MFGKLGKLTIDSERANSISYKWFITAIGVFRLITMLFRIFGRFRLDCCFLTGQFWSFYPLKLFSTFRIRTQKTPPCTKLRLLRHYSQNPSFILVCRWVDETRRNIKRKNKKKTRIWKLYIRSTWEAAPVESILIKLGRFCSRHGHNYSFKTCYWSVQ